MQDLVPSDRLVYQPVNFARYKDMQNELTEDDLIEFIFKMRENNKIYVDKLVSDFWLSVTHEALLYRRMKLGMRKSNLTLSLRASTMTFLKRNLRLLGQPGTERTTRSD
jgi:hypothetical protein